jgi:molybdate transport system substrate-binding protein
MLRQMRERRPIRWASAFALLLCVIGCGPTADNKSAPTSNPPETKSTTSTQPRELTVAAASDLKFAFDELTSEFERTHPNVHLTVTYGSSGKFFEQLSNRAPFDLFLSADIDYPRKLIEQGLATRDTEFSYAFGHLVVWVPKDSSLDVEQRGIECLLDPAVHKIAIANPKFAPYGRAALAALKSLDVYDRIEDRDHRLVLGDNIAQTAQWVETGAADIGLIAQSLAMSPSLRDKGRSWLVPETAHPPLEQGGVILSWAKNREAAEALRLFMTSKAGRLILEKYGFTVPKGIGDRG